MPARDPLMRRLVALSLLALTACARPSQGPSTATAPAPQATMPPVEAARPPVPCVSDREAAPGVRWRQYAGISPRWRQPLFINVLEFDPRDRRYRLAVVPAHGPLPSRRESTRRIARRLGATAAINGSYFNFVARRTNGDPIGLVLAGGACVNPARGDRPALGIMPDHRVFFGWPRRERDPVSLAQLARFEPDAPAATPGPMPWWHGLFHRDVAAAATQAPPPPNATGLGAPWSTAADGLEGGPMLVHDGHRVPLKGFNWSILHGREPRTAVGLTRTGSMLWVTVDGRRPGHSMGTNLDEVTRLFLSLGAVEAMNWDGGGSTTLVVAGKVVTQIATGWCREVSNALVLMPASASAAI